VSWVNSAIPETIEALPVSASGFGPNRGKSFGIRRLIVNTITAIGKNASGCAARHPTSADWRLASPIASARRSDIRLGPMRWRI